MTSLISYIGSKAVVNFIKRIFLATTVFFKRLFHLIYISLFDKPLWVTLLIFGGLILTGVVIFIVWSTSPYRDYLKDRQSQRYGKYRRRKYTKKRLKQIRADNRKYKLHKK